MEFRSATHRQPGNPPEKEPEMPGAEEKKRMRRRNRAFLSGTVTADPQYSHTAHGELFFLFRIAVIRRSGTADEVNVIISGRRLSSSETKIRPGARVKVSGQIRTCNERTDRRTHLRVFLFCLQIRPDGGTPDENSVFLDGFVCRPPVRRISPLGREICDLLLAVNRAYGKSDYIPCIAWGNDARYASSFSVGDRVHLHGRFQSRQYGKKNSRGECEIHVSYEVSAAAVEKDTFR